MYWYEPEHSSAPLIALVAAPKFSFKTESPYSPSITFFFQNQNAVDHATSSFEATEKDEIIFLKNSYF